MEFPEKVCYNTGVLYCIPKPDPQGIGNNNKEELNMNKLSEKTQKLVGTGLLTALVIVIYLLTMGLTIGPFNITFALIPIVVGAALYGWSAGTWLGLVFGAMVLFTGGGNAFLVINAPGTIATVLVKGAAAGAVSGLVYKALEKKNRWAATICAAAAAPIVNTGIFLIGCLLFFMGTINEWAAGAGFENAGVYMISAFVGVNFLVELGTNLVLSSAIVRILDVVKKPSAPKTAG